MSIHIENLTFRYGRLEVLRNVTATAQPSRITAILGPNAAGKSTLLRCIIGALRPASGRVAIDGRAVHAIPAREIATRIAYVPQRSTVSAAFTVRQVVELGRYALAVDPNRVDQAIARLDLVEVADRPYPHLSVGQQQRVSLARAVAQLDPDRRGILILDEPTAAMDLRHIGQGMRLLRELAERGAAVLVAMHDISMAAAIADDVWLLNGGCIVAEGLADRVLEVDRLREIFGVGFQWTTSAEGRPRLLHDALSDGDQGSP